MTRKWRGSAIFGVIMAGVSVTVVARLLAGGWGAGTTNAAQPSAPARAGASGTGTVAGAVEQTPFGPVQVSLSYRGARITNVRLLRAPTGTGRDAMLTNYAAPRLEQEVVSSQSARVDTISGATYTSEGYLASVQSAIDGHT